MESLQLISISVSDNFINEIFNRNSFKNIATFKLITEPEGSAEFCEVNLNEPISKIPDIMFLF